MHVIRFLWSFKIKKKYTCSRLIFQPQKYKAKNMLRISQWYFFWWIYSQEKILFSEINVALFFILNYVAQNRKITRFMQLLIKYIKRNFFWVSYKHLFRIAVFSAKTVINNIQFTKNVQCIFQMNSQGIYLNICHYNQFLKWNPG